VHIADQSGAPRRRLGFFDQDVPTYLDPATADASWTPFLDTAPSITDNAPATAPAPTTTAAAEPSTSWWSSVVSGAGELLGQAAQAGVAVASSALLKKYISAKGVPPAGYTYNSQGNLIPVPAPKSSGTSGTLVVAGLAAAAAVGFLFFRRKR
jgi:LPXTG-motif cell wall-anchored protein